MTGLSRTPRRIAALGAALVLAATVFVTPVAAAKPTCHVEIVASHTSFRSLQAAVQAAPSGAELRVKGTCVGNTTIAKDLVIRGKSNPGFGQATLDGAGAGRVLTIQGGATVTLDGLVVTNGHATYGGAIATVIDLGAPLNVVTVIDSVIRDNSATDRGGGIANDFGRVTLIDTAVRDNSAVIGGGIHDSREEGHLSLSGTSSVSDNLASGDGGGIDVDTHGDVDLYDESSVHHNSAGGSGGGIYMLDSVVTLHDRSSVHSNAAGDNGGGVLIHVCCSVRTLGHQLGQWQFAQQRVSLRRFPGSLACSE